MGLMKAAMKQWTNWKRQRKPIKHGFVIVIRFNATIIIKFNTTYKLLLLDLILLLKIRHSWIKK